MAIRIIYPYTDEADDRMKAIRRREERSWAALASQENWGVRDAIRHGAEVYSHAKLMAEFWQAMYMTELKQRSKRK